MDPMRTNTFTIQLFNHDGRIVVTYNTAKVTTVATNEEADFIIELFDDKYNMHNKITLKAKDHGKNKIQP